MLCYQRSSEVAPSSLVYSAQDDVVPKLESTLVCSVSFDVSFYWNEKFLSE
jgi:hypothetical protein